MIIMNLIIDLCGPLITIDTGKIDRRLHALGVETEECYLKMYREGRVKEFDMGVITREEFCDNVREVLRCNMDNRSIFEAWNDLIVDFDLRNVEAVRKLAQKHRLFLLSNSDVENEACFRRYINGKVGYDFFARYFDEAVFSNAVKMRKPDPAIFRYVVERHGLVAEETMLIDDCCKHCDNALKAGIRAWQCKGSIYNFESEILMTIRKNENNK